MTARRAGGRDAEAGAAERRLAEALRAQASLSARSTPGPAAPVKPVAKPATPKRSGQRSTHKHGGHNPVPKGPSPKGGPTVPPVHAKPTSVPAPVTSVRAGSGQSGSRARDGQSAPQHAAPRPAGAPLAPLAGRNGGRPARPRDDQLPTTKVVTAEPGAAGAPTTQHPPAPPTAARTFLDARLLVALLVGLLAGVLLGCTLALLSIVDPGLLPAIG